MCYFNKRNEISLYLTHTTFLQPTIRVDPLFALIANYYYYSYR